MALPFLIHLFIFRPAPLDRAVPAAWGLAEAKPVTFRAPEGPALSGWWVPPSRPRATAILLVHGRSGNISTRGTIARRLAADGYGILLFDYRGYGRSEGRPSERGIEEDSLAAYDWLRDQSVDSSRIVILGQSLGNAPAAYVASLRPVAGLVLVSPFTNLPEALGDRFPWLPARALPWPRNRFEVRSRLAGVRAPLALIASRGDRLVPFEHSRRLTAASQGRVIWVEDRDAPHDGLLAKVAADGRLTRLLGEIAKPVDQDLPACPVIPANAGIQAASEPP